MFPQQKSNKGIILGVGIGTLVIIIIIVIVDIVLFTSQKAIFKPYDPPPTPSGAVAPNGNPNNPDKDLLGISEGVQKNISGITSSYLQTNPKTTPSEWGYYKTGQV